MWNEPAHNKTYSKTCATSEDSDQHTRNLIRIFAIACAFYSIQAIQRKINETPCHIGFVYRLIWVFAGHTGLIVGFVVRWQ